MQPGRRTGKDVWAEDEFQKNKGKGHGILEMLSPQMVSSTEGWEAVNSQCPVVLWY